MFDIAHKMFYHRGSNLGADQETTVRTRHGITDWYKIGKGVCQDCTLSPFLFNLDVEYIM